MADNSTGTPSVVRRAAGLATALALLTVLTGVAVAEPSTKDKLEAAEAEFK